MTLLLGKPAIESLRAEMRGPVLGPADAGYEAARKVHNGMIDKRPAVIACCTGVADVMTALAFGIDQRLPVARGGGAQRRREGRLRRRHRYRPLADEGHARGSGRPGRAHRRADLGEFDRETQTFGLATTGGAVSTTGIAGLTLGGGIGWLQRMYGLTCDNLLSADVVTADGRLLTASATDNADLFWGLRGGGGNFGIVTSFDYQLHEVGPVLAGPAVYPLSAAANVFRFYREYTTSAPDNVFLEFGMAALPDGQRVVMLFVVYVGPIEAGEEVVRPIRDFESPLEVAIVPMSYCDVQRAYDGDFPFGLLNYWKSSNLRELSDDAIETMVAFMESAPSDRPMVIIDQFMGRSPGTERRHGVRAPRRRLRPDHRRRLVRPVGAGGAYRLGTQVLECHAAVCQ